MLFPVLVPGFLILQFHTQSQHILGVPVQKTTFPQAHGILPYPISYNSKIRKTQTPQEHSLYLINFS
jgi:hypothetical protein